MSVAVRDLVVSYGSKRVLDRVSVTVESGELFMLLGPSGCGKTTLLRAIAGFVTASSGAIQLGEREVTALPANKRNTGMVFQSFALWPHMTVAENVAFGLRERRVPRAEIDERVARALESTRMAAYGPRRVDELSGGEQQRVALSRALVIRPQCLLLDEPLSNLDAQLRRSMREEIRRICKEFKLTTIYVTHDQKEALAIADRIAVMQSGSILQVGSPSEVYRRPRCRSVATFIGETNLIEARVLSSSGSEVRAETSAGVLVGHAVQSFAAGDNVWLSIRPECLAPHRSDHGPNVLRGERIETTYLGEMALHRLRMGELHLDFFELNPGRCAQLSQIDVSAHPDDIVVLPRDI